VDARWPSVNLSVDEKLVQSGVFADLAQLLPEVAAAGLPELESMTGALGALVQWAACDLERAADILGVEESKVRGTSNRCIARH
jgi:hypothetical protein